MIDEDLEKTLEFANRYRELRGKPPLEELPETIGHLAAQGALSQALEVSVIRHGANGLFYAITRDEEVMKDLQRVGGKLFQTADASVREPEAGKIYEVSLPRYAYKYAR